MRRRDLRHFRPSRETVSLLVLAAASFVYVTAETLPIGLLPQLSAGLRVSNGAVGLLVTIYAAVAGLAAVPLTAWTNHLPRRRLVVGAVALLAGSQLAMAVAPDYAGVLGARVVCALAHGVFWAMLAPVAASLVPADRAGRATAIVFGGNSLALVLGTPIATAIGQLWGWRVGAAVVGTAGVIIVIALRLVLPPLDREVTEGSARDRLAAVPAVVRNRRLLAVCAATSLLVVGHFTAYTYIADLVRRDAGETGLALSVILLVYGAAGIVGNGAVGWITDQRPRLAAVTCLSGVTAALAALAVLAPGSPVLTVASITLWGAAFTAVPICFQSAVLRVAPDARETASAVLVVAFQIGIGGGALIGSVLVDSGRLPDLPAVGMILAAVATVTVLFTRRAFPSRPLAGRDARTDPTAAEPAGRARR